MKIFWGLPLPDMLGSFYRESMKTSVIVIICFLLKQSEVSLYLPYFLIKYFLGENYDSMNLFSIFNFHNYKLQLLYTNFNNNLVWPKRSYYGTADIFNPESRLQIRVRKRS